jgi:arsenate reductase
MSWQGWSAGSTNPHSLKMKVYLYEKCGTCRNAMAWLDKKDVAYEKVAIKERPPNRKELEQMARIYDGNLRRLFNTSGNEYKRLGLKDKLETMKPAEAFALLSKNGMLVKRPFVLTEKGGAVGFKREEWEKLV